MPFCRYPSIFAVILVSLSLFSFSCSDDEDNETTGGTPQSDTDSSNGGALDVNVNSDGAAEDDGGTMSDIPDGGNVPSPDSSNNSNSDRILLGTCLDPPDEADEPQHCQESWISSMAASQAEQMRQEAGQNCTEDDANNEWTPSEEVCPTGEDYIGTCEFEVSPGYTEEYYYLPSNASERQAECENGGGTWVVE